MSIAANVDARIQTVSVTEGTITAQLVDGRTISVPLAWSWRLSEATPEQRARFEIIEGMPRALMQQQIVHIEKLLAFEVRHLMAVPYLLDQRSASLGHSTSLLQAP